MSADFRLEKATDYLKWYKQKHRATKLISKSIYSLPEINGGDLKKYQIIACPGCYPTSILLPLIPLIKKKLIQLDNIIVDSKSGYSGAGRSVHKKYANKNLYESLSAYGVGFHRHNSEIEQEIKTYIGSKFRVTFTPHLIPMFRGILSTIYLKTKGSNDAIKIYNFLKKYHKNNTYVKIAKFNSRPDRS